MEDWKAFEDQIMAKVDSIKNYRKETPIHHIVAQRAPQAQPSRNILSEAGINYRTDTRNLIPLKESFHQRLHTQLYYDLVNIAMFNAKASAGNLKTNVTATLAGIRVVLNTINRFFPI